MLQLQTKRLITSTFLANEFGVSIRTIYRDIKTLEQAGVPVVSEDGKGYSLLEGYKIPPVMFTDNEANAMVTVERLLLKSSDSSLKNEYTKAINKVKAVLQHSTKEKVQLLSDRITTSPVLPEVNTSNSLTEIQSALTNLKVLDITYQSEQSNEKIKRHVEPFALYYSLKENWLLIAYCRLRNDFRMFRLDRILHLQRTDLKFTVHKLTLHEYLSEKERKLLTPDIPLS